MAPLRLIQKHLQTHTLVLHLQKLIQTLSRVLRAMLVSPITQIRIWLLMVKRPLRLMWMLHRLEWMVIKKMQLPRQIWKILLVLISLILILHRELLVLTNWRPMERLKPMVMRERIWMPRRITPLEVQMHRRWPRHSKVWLLAIIREDRPILPMRAIQIAIHLTNHQAKRVKHLQL